MRREQRTTTKSNPIAGRPSPCSSPRTVATTTRADKHLIAPGSLAGTVVQALRHIGPARAAELAQIAAPHLSPNDKKTLASTAVQAPAWMRSTLRRGVPHLPYDARNT